MKKLFNYLMFLSVVFLLSGCDVTFTNKEESTKNINNSKKFELIKIEDEKFLLNNISGELYQINSDNSSKILIKERDYTPQLYIKRGLIGPTSFKIRVKTFPKKSILNYFVELSYLDEDISIKPNSEIWKKNLEKWKDLLLKGNYSIDIDLLDEDNVTIYSKRIALNKNFKYNFNQGFTVEANTLYSPLSSLKPVKINYSYVLPSYEDLNKKLGKK